MEVLMARNYHEKGGQMKWGEGGKV
jgi:hypothetical protein